MIFISFPYGMSVRNLLGSSYLENKNKENLIYFGNFKYDKNKLSTNPNTKFVTKLINYSKFSKIHRFIYLLLTSLVTSKAIQENSNYYYSTLTLIKKKLENNSSNYILDYYKLSFSKIIRFLTLYKFTYKMSIIFLKFILFIFSIKYLVIFLKYKPRKIFFSHIHASQDKGLLLVAKFLKINTIGMVHSWDNPTSKTIIPFKFDKILCWNEIIKDEMVNIYKYKEKNVKIVGIPQFDVYKKFLEHSYKTNISKYKNFYLKNKNTVLFFCPSPAFVPNQKKIIEDLIDLAKKREDINLIIRLHPGQNINFNEYINLDNIFIDIPNNLYFADIAEINLEEQMNDNEFVNLMINTNLTINCFSTTSLDSLYLNIPNITIAYDGVKNKDESLDFYYQWKHYKDLLNFNSISIAKSKFELEKLINKYLSSNDYLSYERIETMKVYSPISNGKAGYKISEEIFN